MHRTRWTLGALGVLGLAAAGYVVGCSNEAEDCDRSLTCPKYLTTTSTDGGTGGDGGNPACAGDPTQAQALVRDECGVFVSASAVQDGDGSKTRPFTKLVDAIAEAEGSGKRVYACAGKAFAEAVTISAGIEVYGGFDCANAWAWSPDARATLDGPADSIPLTIQASAAGVRVDGFKITAASPSDMKSGKSSIAVAAADVEAALVRCDVIASDAAYGADGLTPSDPVIKGADAPDPDAGTMNACVNAASVNGGDPGITTCEDGDTSGGLGGKGGITATNNGDGEKGADGTPLDAVKGKGGTGEATANECSDGTKGKSGTAGDPGLGGSTLDDVLSLSGITSSTATNGKSGTKAQGGGGGGGAKSGVFCPPSASPVDGPGASGGGGGAGGCGGKGGGGGKAGGSSIAILSLGTKLTLDKVTLAVGKAGNGGKGALGQGGGDPGAGASGGAKSGLAGSNNGCKGGDGGSGGPGGPGGGGRGGHAIGIAYAKAPSSLPVIKTFGAGTAGNPGDPGAVGGNIGEQGKAGQCWDFEKHAECGQ